MRNKNTFKILFLLCSVIVSKSSVFAQCGAIDFTAGKAATCAPDLIKFYATNVPPGSTITWDYGSGPVSGKDTGQNIYTTAGTYTVSLQVLLSDGVTVCPVNKPNLITIYAPPSPAFKLSRNVLCAGGDTVTITDISTGGSGRNWVINGLQIPDTTTSIVYNFTNPGYQEIMLIAKSTYCPTSYLRKDSVVSVYNALVVDFAADNVVGCAPVNINFTPQILTAGHTIGSYSWTFTGGNPALSSQTNPLVSYTLAGTYSASLNVTNTEGCTAIVSKTNYITLGDSTNFTVNASKSIACRSEYITLSISNPGLSGSFIWDLGNGNPQVGSTPTNQRVLFNDTGFQYYKVTRNYNGCKTVREYYTQVYLRPPLAKFTILNPIECDSSSKVIVFNNTKISASTTNTYKWNLYGPSGTIVATSPDSIPVFSTTKKGYYSLELIVNSSNGCTDTMKLSNAISRIDPVGSFNIVPTSGCKGKPVTLQSTSPQFSSAEPNFHIWTIYDKNGNPVFTKNSGIIPATSYTFIDTGQFDAQLLVYNSKCKDTVLTKKAIKIVSPNTNYIVSDPLPCKNVPIQLSASSLPSILPESYNYKWVVRHTANSAKKFEADGTPASLEFDSAGVYNFYLVTAWGNGCVDTISLPGYIKVSGPIVTINSDNYSDCVPFTANLSSAVVFNYNYRTPLNPNIQYNWGINPIAGGTLVTPTQPNTQVNFTATNAFAINLRVTNGSGCSDTVELPSLIYSGIISAFATDKTALCMGQTTNVTNLAQLQPDAYRWYSVPSTGVTFSSSASVPSPQIQFNDSGNFTIYQVVSKKNKCYDSSFKVVRSVKTIANFSSQDTLNFCAPAEVFFDNSSVNADSLIWQYGDGKSQTIASVSSFPYVYFKNSPPIGFTVRMVAKNNLGCYDTAIHKNYITIVGPVPNFTLLADKGCSPLEVEIVDNSTSYSQYYFDYGDGSSFDTSGNPATHYYNLGTDTNEVKIFYPVLYLLDPLGCIAEEKYTNGVEVYNVPDLKFSGDPLKDCNPLKVTFKDSSTFATYRQWDFDNNGLFNDTGSNPVYIYINPGSYSVRMRATTKYGCVREDTLFNYITTAGSPTSILSFNRVDSDSAFIYYDFFDNSLNANERWWYVDTTLVENSLSFKYAFPDTGVHLITLITKSIDGCLDTTDTSVFIIPDYYFHVPNAFTPNNKGGNENFGITAPIFAKRFVMRIYNRSGEQLFETDKVYGQWDGTYKGEACQQDMYLYIIEYLDMYSHWNVFHGTLMLLR